MTDAIGALRGQAGTFPDGRCLAGFSGGADSLALMLMLASERDAGRAEPEAVHVNHGLRGAESDEDEAFCRRVCEELRIPLHTVQAELDGKADENACRKARFRCFQTVMDTTGIHTLVLAHNRDDLAETFLMRLLRGAGSEGLDCMSGQDARDGYDIYRPLLTLGRDAIREALRQDGIAWREDSLNGTDAYLRNRVRQKLIPLMEEMAPGVAGRIATTAEILRGENRMLQAEAEAFLRQHSGDGMLDTAALQELPEAMRTRILRTWWRQNGPERDEHSLNARQTAELAALAGAERGKVNLPGGWNAVKGRRGMYLTGLQRETPEAVPLEAETRGEIPFGNGILTITESEGNPGNGVTEQEAPEEFLRDCVIRTRQAGDRIRPFGMKGSRKLQDYLVDRGVDEPARDLIPLICRGQEVLFAAGVGAGAIPSWDGTKKNIRLKWNGRIHGRLAKEEETENGPEF